jgi:hypothetical protein
LAGIHTLNGDITDAEVQWRVGWPEESVFPERLACRDLKVGTKTATDFFEAFKREP